jgi:hypothetical protein
MKKIREWEFKIGVFKGIMFGGRLYEFDTSCSYSLYFFFFVVTLEVDNPHVLF